jgi:hypothetical protein
MSLSQRLIAAAISRGLHEGNPIYVTVDNNGARVAFIVSYSEPFDVVAAPLDVIWVQVSSQQMVRRQSRTSSSGFIHSWEPQSESTIWQSQLWDIPRAANQDLVDLNSNVGNPFLLTLDDLNGVSRAGGQLSGPLFGRPQVDVEDVAPTELVKRNFVDAIIDPVRALSVSVYQQLTSIRNSVTAVRNRTTVVEQRVDQIEQGSIPAFVYNQDESASVWEVDHNLNGRVIVTVLKPNGELMLPSSELRVNANKLLLTFFSPRQGSVSVIKVG